MITRAMYKDIKKYDHKQMNDFLERIYTNGVNKGNEDAIKNLAEMRMKEIENNKIAIDGIREKLIAVKGIGKTKVEQIIKILEGKEDAEASN